MADSNSELKAASEGYLSWINSPDRAERRNKNGVENVEALTTAIYRINSSMLDEPKSLEGNKRGITQYRGILSQALIQYSLQLHHEGVLPADNFYSIGAAEGEKSDPVLDSVVYSLTSGTHNLSERRNAPEKPGLRTNYQSCPDIPGAWVKTERRTVKSPQMTEPWITTTYSLVGEGAVPKPPAESVSVK